MIRIKWHDHTKDSGFGNKLLLSCFAECYSIHSGQSVFNWLVTDILCGGDRDGVLVEDNQSVKWRRVDIDTDTQEKVYIVGQGTALSDNEFHQNPSDISLIKQYKKLVVGDFGCRQGTFVHVRSLDRNRSPSIEYYKKCLSSSSIGYVSSDNPNHSTVRYLLDHFDLKLYEETPEKTIIFASAFDNKVLSLGTFSWWIGFIGNQNNVMYPNPDNYRKWHGPIFQCMDGWRKK